MLPILVLLIESERDNGHAVGPALAEAKLPLLMAHTAKDAFALLKERRPTIIVYNAATMRSSGVRNCSRLRRALPNASLIHIRAPGELEDPNVEADVYLERPFTPRKLLNRIKSLLPPDYDTEEIIWCGPLTIFRNKRMVDVVGKGEGRLTPKLVRLLEEFVRHQNEVVTRTQLMREVWKTDYIGDTRTLDVHIRWVRELIEEDPANPQLLHTVRGEGYIFSISNSNDA